MPGTCSAKSPFADLKHRFAGPAIVLLTFAILAIWTWRRCGDLLQDFGHQLYVPWQLQNGAVLYRDIFWLYGPLSQYFNAALFALCGTGLTTLLMSNLVLIVVLVLAIYLLVAEISDRLSALCASCSVLTLCAFSQYLDEGNFSFMFPYAHEATHGTLLVILEILFLSRALRGGSSLYALAGGICVGAAWLTKLEPAISAAAVYLTFLIFVVKARAWTTAAVSFLSAALPLLTAFWFFTTRLGSAAAIAAAFGAVAPALSSGASLVQDQFHREVLGLNNPIENLRLVAYATSLLLGYFGSIAALDILSKNAPFRRQMTTIVSLLVFGTLFICSGGVPWFELPRAFLPVLCVIGLLCALTRQMYHSSSSVRFIVAAWLAYAVVAASRLGLHMKLYQYGFFLALPATVALSPALLYYAPRALNARWNGGSFFRWVSLASLLAFMAVHVRFTEFYVTARQVPTGVGDDTFYTYSSDFSAEAQDARELLQWLEAFSAKNVSFQILPSGTALNYLLRRPLPNSYPWIGIDVLRVAGEQRILDALSLHPPQFIILRTGPHGVFSFGLPGDDSTVGSRIKNWLRENYVERLRFQSDSTSLELHVHEHVPTLPERSS